MTDYKLTPADLEQMAAATVAMDPAPETVTACTPGARPTPWA